MRPADSDSVFVCHESCPGCGSKDNLARYSDGHAHCFGCGYYEKATGSITMEKPMENKTINMVLGEYSSIPKRGISKETCIQAGYTVGKFNDKPVQIANHYDDQGKQTGQKLRFANKDFISLGEIGLYGKHLTKKQPKKELFITEGEIDALTLMQIFDFKKAVVSVPNGAQGALKAIKSELEFIEQFETVYICFDMDEPGREACDSVAGLLSPGKARIVELPLKDANDMLTQGRITELGDCIRNARTHIPEGIYNASKLKESFMNRPVEEVLSYPWDGLTDKVGGIRPKTLVTVTAGTGVGKSTFISSIGLNLLAKGVKVGMLMLEEGTLDTMDRLVGMTIRKKYTKKTRKNIDPQVLSDGFDKVAEGDRLVLFDYFGSIESDALISKIRYMAKGLDCKVIFLDHLSIAVSGLQGDNERKLIDTLMTTLRKLVEETGITLFVNSHLTRNKNKGSFEEGEQISLSDLRGSHAIAQLSDDVIALERNQQSDNPQSANIVTIRILKAREAGLSGVATKLVYDNETGLFTEIDEMTLATNNNNINEDF